MARAFDDGSSQYLRVTSAPASAYPFVLTGWCNSDDAALNQCVMGIGDSSSGYYHALRLRGDLANDYVHANSYGPSGNHSAVTTGGYSADTWHHVCALYVAATDRRILIDNGNKGTDSNDPGSITMDQTAIGASPDSTTSLYMSGNVAEAAVYDLSAWPGATDSDKADNFESIALPSLAVGASPLLYSLGLVAYWPLIRTDQDLVGGYDMTPYNSPTWMDHPPGIIPWWYKLWTLGLPAAAGVMKQMMHLARLRRG